MQKNKHAIPLDSLPPALRYEAEAQLGIPHHEKEHPLIVRRNASEPFPPPDAPRKQKMTKTEELFLQLLKSKQTDAGNIEKILFEGITLTLPGGSRYTPDFYVLTKTKEVWLFEVKGDYKLGSHGRALTAWKEARAFFNGFRFLWAERDKTAPNGFVFKHD
jgi:hypothetical protein